MAFCAALAVSRVFPDWAIFASICAERPEKVWRTSSGTASSSKVESREMVTA